MKHFISLYDLTTDEIYQLLNLSIKLKKQLKANEDHHILSGKTLGMIFTKSSTRTRVSFEVGMYQLGGMALFLNPNDIQLGRGETIEDTAQVLSRYLDGIMIRTFQHSDVLALAEYGTIPVINALTDDEHPCQVLADFLTIYEHKSRLKGLKLAYIGDGNNMANSLLQGCAKVGMDISVASPEKYTCNLKYVEQAKEVAVKTGAKVVITLDPAEAAANADIIYTDTWASMGQEDEKAERTEIFLPYQVNDALFSDAKNDAIFMHCLPAYRGYEVTESVIDGPRSVVFDEAENRLHAQKAIMAVLMG
ncbi:MAG: ornithine carbamoyltransferase [Clostridiales bacterium]|jgi:ornithine carbamoyltransferase|nr:ornithine carbamoyltransferase [Clostridiales bacterium]